VELSKAADTVEKPVSEMGAAELWAVYFRYLTDKSKRKKINEVIACEEGIAMASEVLMTISRDEAERARLVSEYKYVVDTQSKVVQAKREGIQEGRKKGNKERAIKIARALKDIGDLAEKIAQVTGLSPEEIAKL
jgi:predicted transposase/invertase (TIGR01784 family)